MLSSMWSAMLLLALASAAVVEESQISCQDPGTPANGDRIIDGLDYEDTVTFQCDTGYWMFNAPNNVVTCLATGLWSHPRPTCEPIICPDPGKPLCPSTAQCSSRTIQHGIQRDTPVPYLYTDRVVWACAESYALEGDPTAEHTAKCQANRTWSANPPSCYAVDCELPPAPDNGQRVVEGLRDGNAVNWTCDEGYRIEGAHRAICSSASWSEYTPECKPIICPDPGKPLCLPDEQCSTRTIQHGIQRNTPVPYLYTDRVVWGCAEWFALEGDPTAEHTANCQANGTWSANPPSCYANDCELPLAPDNGQRVVEGLSDGNAVHWTCDEGYRIEGAHRAVCSGTSWSEYTPKCKPIKCSNLSGLDNGRMNMTSTLFLGEASFQCDPGFALVGANQLVCMSTGGWSSDPPVCEQKFCQDPGVPANGRRVSEDFSVGGMLQYVCHEGFTMAGEARVTCKDNTEWDRRLPTCDQAFTPGPPPFESFLFPHISETGASSDDTSATAPGVATHELTPGDDTTAATPGVPSTDSMLTDTINMTIANGTITGTSTTDVTEEPNRIGQLSGADSNINLSAILLVFISATASVVID